MAEKITVYSKTHCPQCDATKRRLDRIGVPYDEINLDENKEARDELVSLGFKATPIVMAGSVSWSGYRPDMIDALKLVH